MPERASPRLRSANKVPPPYPLNQFPKDFGFKLGTEIVYLLGTKSTATLIGPEWEQIFASCIGAEWHPSAIGLDDVVLGTCAWGAKTVNNPNPARAKSVRLISGRNSVAFSFDVHDIKKRSPNEIGEKVLSIWNERVSDVRGQFGHVRTVVLLKGPGLLNVAVFEMDTLRYDPELCTWDRNRNGNLIGMHKGFGHKFTWQPHGAQFTITEGVPDECLLVSVRKPPHLDKNIYLKGLKFDKSWVKVERRTSR